MRKTTAILILALVVSALAYFVLVDRLVRESTPDKLTAITGGRLIQGAGGAVIEDAVVLIENGRVARVFPTGEGEIPSGAKVIDARGASLLPGLMDCRVGLLLNSAGAAMSAEEYLPDRVVRDLRASLYWGVTSVQSAGDSLAWMIRLRDNERSGSILSPRLRTSGPLLTASGGYPSLHLPSTVAQESTRQVKDIPQTREVIVSLVNQNVDALSIVYEGESAARPYPKLALPLFQEAVTKARETGLRVTARVGSRAELKDAVRAGVTGIELVTDEALDDEAMRLMRERGTYYISTLSPRLRDAQSADDIHELVDRDDTRRTVSAGVRKGLVSNESYFARLKADPQSARYQRAVWDASRANLLLAARNGVRIVLGTGAGHPAVFYGLSAHDELRLLTEAGLTTAQAIEAATRTAAEYMGVDNALGTIETGKLADILITNGNPLVEIARSRAIRYVIKGAVVINRESLLQ